MIPPTFLLAANSDEDEENHRSKNLLGWIVPASVALHVAVVVLLPHSRSVALSLRPPQSVILEMQDTPPPPPPKPKPVDTTEKPLPAPSPQRAAAAAKPDQRQEATPPRPQFEAPLDFSSMTFSNDGPGLALGTPRSALDPAPKSAASTPAAAPPPPAAPTFVPLASLKRAPRSPAGLDAELEKNYPSEARRSGISGNAVLKVELQPDGRVGRVDVVSESYAGFGQACTRTVKSARWEPPLDRDGHPVATEIKYVCRFEVGS